MTKFESNIQTIFVLLLVLITPLFMNSNAAIAELGAEVIGVVMLLILFWNNSYRDNIPIAHWIFIIFSVAAVSIYLVPIPEAYWVNLPGRETYREVIEFVIEQTGNEDVEYTLTVIPENTKGALFYLIPLVATYLVTMSLPSQNIKFLIVGLLIITTFEAALGIVQYSTGSELLYIDEKHGDNANGTYANRDHYVVLFEFTLPILLGMLVPKFDRQKNKGVVVSRRSTLITLIMVFLLASILSGSRGGIGVILVGMFLASFIYAYRLESIKSFGLFTIGSILAVGVILKMGITPILNRFALDPLEDGRWIIFENTNKIISDFLPLGSGPATMPEVYRAYQPIDQQTFVNHAHNDYLELAADMGYLGMMIIAIFILLFVLRWLWLLSNIRTNKITNLQIGAGIGMLLLLIHSVVDFNFHVLANALIFILLSGIFFKKGLFTRA